MYLLFVSGLLCTAVVFAGVLNKAKMQLYLNEDGSRISQDVALNYRDNYIEIEPPAIEGKTAPTIMHDVTEDMTLLKQAAHCFMLTDGFGTFSTEMDDWLKFTEGDEVEAIDVNDEGIAFYNYSSAALFCLDREKLPLLMQDGCDEIYPAILTNIIYGRRARRLVENFESSFVWRMYGPTSQDRNIKRGFTPQRRSTEIQTRRVAIGASVGVSYAGIGVNIGVGVEF